MGIAAPHKKVKLMVGLISAKSELFDDIESALKQKFGETDFKSEKIRFSFTSYYEDELGSGLNRIFLSFKRLISPCELSKIKIYTNRLEKKFSKDGNRTINIDPGYLTDAKIVLATTKDHQHRLYITQGIYEEVTLRFRAGTFRPWAWTYPDYRTKRYIKIFNKIRERYIALCRKKN